MGLKENSAVKDGKNLGPSRDRKCFTGWCQGFWFRSGKFLKLGGSFTQVCFIGGFAHLTPLRRA
jgi:hypothetical protein